MEHYKENDNKRIRLYLFLGSVLTIGIVAGFLVILNVNEPAEYTSVPIQVLVILTILSCVALAVFFAKGPVFNIDGELESVNINAMLLTVLIIIQVAFFFEILSVRNQIMNYQKYEVIRKDIALTEKVSGEKLAQSLPELCTNGIYEITIVNEKGIAQYSSKEDILGKKPSKTRYTYPFGRGKEIRFYYDEGHSRKMMQNILLNLLTVLVTSVFFTVETVLLMIRLIMRSMAKKRALVSQEKPMLSSLYYIRQIAFLFYFASRLSSAFIPILTKTLDNPFPWLSGTAAAGLPQSAETLLTCSAIFITTIILEKKGWKLPFLWGLSMVAAGTLLSAFSGNLILFILARAIVGLGYGFCWMTLRNLSLFGKDNREQLLGFALLNTGIYAGMNCGSSLGAILAELFGYKAVFVISAGMTLLTSLFIIRMENALLPHKEVVEEPSQERYKQKRGASLQQMVALLFVVLMIAPSCIAASYLSYYLPLYFSSIGRSITDVGRAQLLYGLVIVYGGPFLSVLIAGYKQNALKNINFAYNVMIAASLFLPGVAAGLILPFVGAALLGTADSFGFGVQNNYFLALPAVKKLGASKSLSVLSFIKKLLEMMGPMVFALAISFGYQMGIRVLAILFAVMAITFMVFSALTSRTEKQEV
ncbi:MAG: MFS transporter [Lachnospiraceae bacterium]|jgi:predicted MFS family arabinose efflux permease|nr:MFS transporter [Lachnospiraceae bacterium]